MSIHLLPSDKFVGQIAPPKKTGISALFRAKIELNDSPECCFVKPLPDLIYCPVAQSPVPNREATAEAIGYALAKRSGFEVPAEAGIILLTLEQIPQELHAKLIEGGGELQQDYLCWFSKDMAYPNIIQHINLDDLPCDTVAQALRRVVEELAQKPETCRIVAFDDWLANSDRNLGNLLAAPVNPMLIDHGRIFFYPNWSPGQLGFPEPANANLLLNALESVSPGWSDKLPNKSARAMAYASFIKIMRADECKKELSAFLAEFFDQSQINAIIQLLESRLDTDNYNQKIGLIA